MQIRPQLYCDAKWYRNRSISECMLADPAFQIRPNLDELTILSQIGVLQPSTIAYDPVAPVMTQPVCSGFYGMGPVPKPVTKRRAVDEARAKPRKTTIAIQSSVKPSWQQNASSRKAAEESQDPCHDTTYADQPSLNDVWTTTVPAGGIRGSSMNTDATNASEELIQGLEAKVLSLEEEVLVYKRSGVEKNRRIRALEQEHERLRRGESDLRASKRPRLQGGSPGLTK